MFLRVFVFLVGCLGWRSGACVLDGACVSGRVRGLGGTCFGLAMTLVYTHTIVHNVPQPR